MSILYPGKHLWGISLGLLTRHAHTTCSLRSRMKPGFKPGREPGKMIQTAGFATPGQKIQHTGWWDAHEMCCQTLWYGVLERHKCVQSTEYTCHGYMHYVGSAHSVRKEDLGTLSRPKVFSAVDRIGICSQGEEDASRWNLHLIAGSTDPQLLFLIIYCYLDTYNILDPPSNPYDSPGSCSPSSQTRPFFLDTSHITSSTVSHWRLKQQPIGASENSFSFLAFCQSLWTSSNQADLHFRWQHCTKGGVASHNHLPKQHFKTRIFILYPIDIYRILSIVYPPLLTCRGILFRRALRISLLIWHSMQILGPSQLILQPYNLLYW